MIEKEKVLSIVRDKGPLIPRDVVKLIGGDTFIVGAVLSTLVDSKEVKMSSAKIGGSPVYYLIGQEAKLEILYKFLPEKERKTYDTLKQNKVLRDTELDAVNRVACRSIKDFAKPFEVVVNGNKEIFWKWHLTLNQEAEGIIRERYFPKKKEEKVQESIKPDLKNIEAIKVKDADQKPEEAKHEEKAEQGNAPPEKSRSGVINQPQDPAQKKDMEKNEVIDEFIIPIEKAGQKQKKLIEEIQPIPEQPALKKQGGKPEGKTATDSIFLIRIKKVFEEKGIEISETEIIKKNSEIDMIVFVPSPVGKLKFYCKAVDKKKSSDKDLSFVYVGGQMKKLPVLYLITGDLTKRAEEMANLEFKTISILKV